MFFIETDTGQVATQRQLIAAGVANETSPPPRPWLRIQGPGDASTMWYAVLRLKTRAVFIGTLCIRHSTHYAYLRGRGWEDVAIEDIGVAGP